MGYKVKNFLKVSFSTYSIGVAVFTTVLAAFLVFSQQESGTLFLAIKTASKFSLCFGAVVPLIYNTVAQKLDGKRILISWIFWCAWGGTLTYLLYRQ